MEQIAFPTGSVAFLGASFLSEICILKFIMSRDLPTVNSDFPSEGDPWGVCPCCSTSSPQAC